MDFTGRGSNEETLEVMVLLCAPAPNFIPAQGTGPLRMVRGEREDRMSNKSSSCGNRAILS